MATNVGPLSAATVAACTLLENSLLMCHWRRPEHKRWVDRGETKTKGIPFFALKRYFAHASSASWAVSVRVVSSFTSEGLATNHSTLCCLTRIWASLQAPTREGDMDIATKRWNRRIPCRKTGTRRASVAEAGYRHTSTSERTTVATVSPVPTCGNVPHVPTRSLARI